MTDAKLRHHLGPRFFVRWHMSLILAGVVCAGIGMSRVLLAAGVRSLPVRWLLVLAFAYLVFFLLVRLWMAYVARWPAEAEAAARLRYRRPGSILDTLSAADVGLAHGLAETIALLVLGVVLVLLFGIAAWVIIEAPVLLAEAAFQALLASGLLPATRRLEAHSWVGNLFRDTAVPFSVVVAVTVGTGWLIQWVCPDVARLADLFARCGR